MDLGKEEKMNDNLKIKISQIPEIVQLDFEHDNLLFIDPYRINSSKSILLKEAKKKVIDYFDIFFDAVKNNSIDTVEIIGKELHEINATKLGYTSNVSRPNGNGFCLRDLINIFYEAQKADKKLLIEDMPDVLVFAENIGPDKVSDLVTNIIYEDLLEFTRQIIIKYNLPIKFEERKKWIFDFYDWKWVNRKVLIPIVDNQEIIFIPEGIASGKEIFSYKSFYHDLVYPYYKSNASMYGLIKLLKDGKTERPDCQKIHDRYPIRRDTVANFKLSHLNEYNEHKNHILNDNWKNLN